MIRSIARLIVLGATALSSAPLSVRAQTTPVAATQAVERLFLDASAKEAAVRKVLAAPDPQDTLLKAVRTVVSDYESLVRSFPSSAYCDDALWRAAKLSEAAFSVFGDPREQGVARRLYKSLASQYPSSQFVRRIPADATGFADAGSVTSPPVRPANAVARTVAAPAPPKPAGVATITAIRRVALGQVVRIVVELDREVAFRDERIADPMRVFVDLPSTRAVAALKDQTIRFAVDDGPIKLVRLGRHPNDTTRVVLDAEGVSSYSVYPLYSPYRLIIDCLRADAGTGDGEGQTLVAAVRPPEAPRSAEAPRPAEPIVRPVEIMPVPANVPTVPASMEATARPVELIVQEIMLPPAEPRAPLTAKALPGTSALALDPVLDTRRIDAWQTRLPGLDGVALDFAFEAIPTEPIPSINTVAPSAAPARPSMPATATTAAAPMPPPPTPPDRNLAGGFSMARQLGLRVSRVVIDPGHGGHDPGAKGAGITEADLVLDVSLRLAALLAEVPGIEPILTRRTNEYIALQERTAIANRQNADLFLSIHANASNSAQVHGVETYVLNFATTLSSAAVAARENAAAGPTMNALPEVVKTIALHNKLDESRDLATMVQREMVTKLRPSNKSLRDLGVKQAPFVVLIGAAMPSVLAEIAFMTNPKEAPLLKSTRYRQLIAEALFQAVRKYQLSLSDAPAFAQKSRQ